MLEAYYYKVRVEQESLPSFLTEFRIFAHSKTNADYILKKATISYGFYDCTVERYAVYEIIGNYSPILESASKGLEGYFQYLEFDSDISIEALLPYIPVNVRLDFIDSILEEI